MHFNHRPQVLGKKIAVSSLTIALTLGMSPITAFAATSTELQAQLEAAQAESASFEEKTMAAFQEYEVAQAQLEETEGKIESVQSEIDEKQTELEAAQDTLGEYEVADYKSSSSFLGIIFSSTSFEDFVSRVHYASKVASSYSEQIQNVQAIQADLDTKKSELESEQAEQQELANSAEEKASAMQAAQEEHEAYIASLSEDVQEALAAEEAARQAELQRQAEEAAAAVAAAQAAAQAANTSNNTAATTTDSAASTDNSNSNNSSDSSNSDSSSTDNSSSIDTADYGSGIGGAISAALSKQGNSAYSYGASGPYYFDCSGLVWWAYQQAGISIPRGQNMGRNGSNSMVYRALNGGSWTTDASQLQAGDLMFWSYSGDINNTYHVGMCIGGGLMVHCIPGGVQVASVNWQSGSFVGGGSVI